MSEVDQPQPLPGLLPNPLEDIPAIIIEAPPPSYVPGSGIPARIPHLGHAILFLSFTGLILVLAQAFLLAITHTSHVPHALTPFVLQPRYLIAAEAFTYISSFAASFFIFPLLWMRPFLDGIRWNFAAARRNLLRLILLGVALGFTVQAISSLVPMPKSIPMDSFFRNSLDVWLITAFGTLIAPAFEEICFRGFLLPAFAIAYDWLSLPRTPAARERWHTTTNLTPAALIFSTILTSIFFALLHAEQLAHAWAALFILFCVSLILTLVRIRTGSVACSALVHASYNFSVFLILFVATGGYRHLDRMLH